MGGDLGTPRFWAWTKIVLGIGAAIVGLASLLDSSSTKIYLGAILVGPIIAYRGIRELQQLAEFDTLHPEVNDLPISSQRGIEAEPYVARESSGPDDVRAAALEPKRVRVISPCEACSKSYVYFPELTVTSKVQYECLRHAGAPCPSCGWMQSYMIDLMGEFTAPHWSTKCFVPFVALLIGSGAFAVYNLNVFHGTGAPIDPNQPYYWFANLAIFLACVGCGAASLYGNFRRPNPNAAPVERRLARGRLLGMPLEEYEALLKANESSQSAPIAPETGIKSVEASIRRADSAP